MHTQFIKKLKSSPGLAGRLLLAIAALLSLYLAAISLTQTPLLGCEERSGCYDVLATRWAYLFGFPASFPAVAVYVIAVLAAGAFEARNQRTWIGTIGEIALLMIVVAAVWFISIQFFVAHRLCIWCSLVHVFALTGVFFLMVSRRLQPRPDETEEDWAEARLLRNHALFGVVRASAVVIGAVALAVGPFVNQSASNVVKTLAESPSQSLVNDSSVLSFDKGRIAFHPADLPLMGKTSATDFALALVDYSCEFCRLYHASLADLARRRGDHFAVVLLPASLDDNSAQIHHAMLCLFRADPEKYQTLSAELIRGTHPPEGEAVRMSARGLLGDEGWAEAQRNYGTWAASQIQMTRELRAYNQTVLSSARLPQLVAGSEVLLGYSDDVPALDKFVSKGLRGIATKSAEPLNNAAPGAEISAGSPPTLTIQSPVHDFGMIEGGESVDVKISFENTGDEDLEVKFVSLDQDCELVSLPATPLAKGCLGEIEIKVTAPLDVTSIQRRVQIYSNAPAPTQLLLQARVHNATSQSATTP